jgi:hypothetical protein
MDPLLLLCVTSVALMLLCLHLLHRCTKLSTELEKERDWTRARSGPEWAYDDCLMKTRSGGEVYIAREPTSGYGHVPPLIAVSVGRYEYTSAPPAAMTEDEVMWLVDELMDRATRMRDMGASK